MSAIEILNVLVAADEAACGKPNPDAREARDAVVELLEADREFDRAQAAMTAFILAGPRPHSYGTGWEVRDAATKRELEANLDAAHKRRDAALARFPQESTR